MIAPTTEKDLQRIWEEKDRQVRLLEKEVAEARREMDACALLLARHHVAAEVAGTELAHAHIRPSVLANCRTHLDAFREIAVRSGGIVRMGEAGKLVKEGRSSNAKPGSITSSMYSQMERSDDWEYAAPGTYRYLPYQDQDGNEEEPPWQEPEQDESCPTDSGDKLDPSCPDDAGSEVALGRIIA